MLMPKSKSCRRSSHTPWLAPLWFAGEGQCVAENLSAVVLRRGSLLPNCEVKNWSMTNEPTAQNGATITYPETLGSRSHPCLLGAPLGAAGRPSTPRAQPASHTSSPSVLARQRAKLALGALGTSGNGTGDASCNSHHTGGGTSSIEAATQRAPRPKIEQLTTSSTSQKAENSGRVLTR